LPMQYNLMMRAISLPMLVAPEHRLMVFLLLVIVSIKSIDKQSLQRAWVVWRPLMLNVGLASRNKRVSSAPDEPKLLG